MDNFLEATKKKIRETETILKKLKVKQKYDPENVQLLFSISSYKDMLDQLIDEFIQECELKAINNIFYRVYTENDKYNLVDISQSLIGFQTLFSLVYDVILTGSSKKKGVVKTASKNKTVLNLDFVYNGSLGFALSGDNELMLLDSEIEQALDYTVSILSLRTPDELQKFLDVFGYSIYPVLLSWAESNINNKNGVEIKVLTSNRKTIHSDISVQSINSLKSMLKTSPIIKNEILCFSNALLVGVDIEKRVFNIKYGDNYYFGSMDESIEESFNVPKEYSVKIEKQSVNANGKEKISYRLLSIDLIH